MAYDAVCDSKQYGENKRTHSIDKQVAVLQLVVRQKATHYAVGCKNKHEYGDIIRQTTFSDISHTVINKGMHCVYKVEPQSSDRIARNRRRKQETGEKISIEVYVVHVHLLVKEYLRALPELVLALGGEISAGASLRDHRLHVFVAFEIVLETLGNVMSLRHYAHSVGHVLHYAVHK